MTPAEPITKAEAVRRPTNGTRELALPVSLCRFCGARLRHTFADLGMSPLSNANVRPNQLKNSEKFYPLRAFVCEACFLVQLEESESPDEIFRDYPYFSSYSDTWLKHAQRYVETMIERFQLTSSSQVIEIASNDGYLLQYFVAHQIAVLGIEPAANIAAYATVKGIPTLVQFFGRKVARALAEVGRRADLMVANNVVAHVPDINDFVGGFALLLKPHGVVTFEFHHVQRLIELNQFDTIYHEHFCYHSLTTFCQILARQGLSVFDVEELRTHGGSLRVYAQLTETGEQPVSPRVDGLLAREAAFGLTRLEPYLAFANRVQQMKFELLLFLLKVKVEGKKIVGYGAPAKGNTLLNYAGVRTDFLDFTVDRNPHKQGLYLPGTHIPIYAPEKISEVKPDYVLILAWNLKDEIMEQMAHIRAWGGKFLVLIPEVTIYD